MNQNNPVVFLIDDDTDDQEIFSLAMEKANLSADCVFANDGLQALEKINSEKAFRPDYIFLDINMPRMNGRECLAELKKIDRLKNIPVFIYSTSADPQTVAENKRLGAVEFIVKPPSIHELTSILKRIIRRNFLGAILLLAIFSLPKNSSAQRDTLAPVKELKKLSVEELLNVVVTSVSKTPERLTEVASAIQVIRGSDIVRSTATRLPEVLQLAPNLQVAQSGSHDWGISARGFNGAPVASSSLADKLLVMIDGRTVYNPLFGGVYWDVQNVLLSDIDRIEIVSGPGGTLWGANAVNGVVNVISKSARETQGVLVSGSVGSLLKDKATVRYGGSIDSTFFFRVYGQRYDYNNTLNRDGSDGRDSWNDTHGGFRMDYYPSEKNTFTLQGDMYRGVEDDTLPTKFNGQNIIGRFTHTFSEKSDIVLQLYYDRTYRYIPSSPLIDIVNTYDAELQHHFSLGKRNRILWGAGYRDINDNTITPQRTFEPASRTLEQINVFIQDQIAVVPEKVELTVGSKLLHNYYTGYEVQPSVRIAWTPSDAHTVWTAVSRAVRTPSRFDADIRTFNLIEHPEFKSEEVVAYELGYRIQRSKRWNASLATFYNKYDDLRSFNFTGDSLVPVVFGNSLAATTWGAEISLSVIAADWWTLRGGYTYLEKDFTYKDPNVFPDNELIEGIDPAQQFLVQSAMDITSNIKLDLVGRFIDELPVSSFTPFTGAYFVFNAAIGYTYKAVTVRVTGRNLPTESHAEFGTKKIPRSITGSVTLRF